MTTREVISALAALLTMVIALAGGVATFVRLDNRVANLEADRVWKADMERRQRVDERRWAKYYNLWDDEIREREAAVEAEGVE